MLARALIIEAYYWSGIVARRFETVDGTQISDGLRLLNRILSEKSINGRYLPFYDHITVPVVANDPLYEIDDLVRVEDVTFNIHSVRYSMVEVSRDIFWATSRAENISSLPYFYYVERGNDGVMKLYVYFSPTAQIDFFTVTGQKRIPSVTMEEEMDDILPDYYQDYLIYKLARRICNFNQTSFPPDSQNMLNDVERAIAEMNPIDYSMTVTNLFTRQQSINYPQINLAPDGWTKSR